MNANNSVEYGPQPDGEFSRPHIDVIQERMVNQAKRRMPDTDWSRGSPPRHLIDVFSIEVVDLWESLENTYWSAFYPYAAGPQLDHVLGVTGVGRIPRRGATGEVRFEGVTSERQLISSGTRVATSINEDQDIRRIPFRTTEKAVIPEGEAYARKVPIKALNAQEAAELGINVDLLGVDTNVPAQSIDEIIDPVSGVIEVTNLEPTGEAGTRQDGTDYDFVSGRDRETDNEYRLRYEESLALNAKASLPAIEANVFNVPEVESVRGEENTDNSASNGIDAHGFRVTVLAPNNASVNDKIAQEIFDTRSAGIPSSGATTGTAIATDGGEVQESMEYASEVRVYVDASVDVLDTFQSDTGVETIKRNIVAYAGGTGPEGREYSGQKIGDDVIYDKVFGAIMNVEDVYRAPTVNIGTSSSPTGTTDVAIGDFEVGRIDAADITVSTTTVEKA